MRRRAPLATLLGSALAAFACAHGGEADIAVLASNSDQLIWEEGQKAFAKKNWESARQHFKRIVDGFPQSSLQPAARLALADSHHQEGGAANYILAVSAYREFLTLYPSHPRADYAQFQVGECFFRQRNGPDRDQTPTLHALEEFQRLLEIYPSSGQMETARERIATCRQSLARAEFLAGYFYQRTRQACRAAIGRYEGILSDYPDYSRLDEVLYRLAQCLAAAGREPEARPHLGRLVEGYPQSEWADEAQELMNRLSQAPAPAPAVAPVAPASPPPDTTP